jgi:hypothetical protein
MTFTVQHKGRTFTWIEKGRGAWLTVEVNAKTTRMLWAGDPVDPIDLRRLDSLKAEGVNLEVLLKLSVERNIRKAT